MVDEITKKIEQDIKQEAERPEIILQAKISKEGKLSLEVPNDLAVASYLLSCLNAALMMQHLQKIQPKEKPKRNRIIQSIFGGK